jgi:hypothetical protein
MTLARAHGPYFKFALVVVNMIFGSDQTHDVNDVQIANILFEPIGVGWRCVSCAEARGVDRAWTGNTEEQINSHCQAHQMGFDFALYYLKKAGRLK